MIDDFLAGKLAVELDKTNKASIIVFYEIIKNYTQGYTTPAKWVEPLYYFLAADSGPYHFILPKTCHFNGGSFRYCESQGLEVVSVYDFNKSYERYNIIEDKELMELFQ